MEEITKKYGRQDLARRLLDKSTLICASSLMSAIASVAEQGEFRDYSEEIYEMRGQYDWEAAGRERLVEMFKDWEWSRIHDVAEDDGYYDVYISELGDAGKLSISVDKLEEWVGDKHLLDEKDDHVYCELIDKVASDADQMIEFYHRELRKAFFDCLLDDYDLLEYVTEETHDALIDKLVSKVSDWQAFCYTYDADYDDYFCETYEFWIVDYWLARKLREQGSHVVDFFGLNIYCRGCTGQSMALDRNMQQIAIELWPDEYNGNEY